VFISSTSIDLKEEREAIHNALERMKDTETVMMEVFGSRPGTPKDACLAEVTACDIYVGVFGWRYGYVEPDSGLSITELEYREAVQRRLPCLIYLKESEDKSRAEESDPAALAKLERLKAHLRATHVVSTFRDPQNLAMHIAIDLHNLIADHRLPQPAEKQRLASSRELYIIITTRLSLEELKTLCFFLEVPWDHLAGEALPGKTRSLVEFLSNRERLEELQVELRAMRPDIELEDVALRSKAGKLRRGRPNEVRLAIAAADFSSPVGSLLTKLWTHLGFWQRRNTARLLRAIRKQRMADDEVRGALNTIEPVVAAVRSNAALQGVSVVSALCDQVCRITERSEKERHKLTILLPLVPIILGSPDRVAIDGVDQLERMWKRLTGWWPPPKLVLISISVVALLVIYGLFLLAVQDPVLCDVLESATGEPELLSPGVWEYQNQLGWRRFGSHLEMASPGVALLRADRLRSRRLGDFGLSFVTGMAAGAETSWILRAQKLAAPKEIQGYQFVLRSSGPIVYLNGYALPKRRLLSGGGALAVGEFTPAKDMFQIEGQIRGATFNYTVRRIALKEYFEERSVTDGFGRAFSVRIYDSERQYSGGSAGLMGPSAAGGRVRVEGPFCVQPAWRWY
jgi:hypothetical protein